jgi:hypothetical protein
MSVATKNPFAILDGRSLLFLLLFVSHLFQMRSPSRSKQRQRILRPPLNPLSLLHATPKSSGVEVLLLVAASTIPEEERLKPKKKPPLRRSLPPKIKGNVRDSPLCPFSHS